MIHLDTSILIAVSDPSDAHVSFAKRLLSRGQPMAVSACVWSEFHSRPVDPLHAKVLARLLEGGIVSFDEATARLAGELFYLTGSNRRTQMDAMIAATAIQAGAELATANPGDFRPFVRFGLSVIPSK